MDEDAIPGGLSSCNRHSLVEIDAEADGGQRRERVACVTQCKFDHGVLLSFEVSEMFLLDYSSWSLLHLEPLIRVYWATALSASPEQAICARLGNDGCRGDIAKTG